MAMDGEGAHGCERGEDQVCLRRSWCNATLIDRTYQDFERKAALFSLASSDVMIVNLWEHQVDCIKKPIWVFSRPSLKSTWVSSESGLKWVYHALSLLVLNL